MAYSCYYLLNTTIIIIVVLYPRAAACVPILYISILLTSHTHPKMTAAALSGRVRICRRRRRGRTDLNPLVYYLSSRYYNIYSEAYNGHELKV